MAKANNATNGTTLDVEDAIDGQTTVHRQIILCYVQVNCMGNIIKKCQMMTKQTYLLSPTDL